MTADGIYIPNAYIAAVVGGVVVAVLLSFLGGWLGGRALMLKHVRRWLGRTARRITLEGRGRRREVRVHMPEWPNCHFPAACHNCGNKFVGDECELRCERC